MKVFLGGTKNGSKWRDYVISRLKIDYFNPVVEQASELAYQLEEQEQKSADYCLYVITPKINNYYSLAEVVDKSYKEADRTIFCYLQEDEDERFNETQKEALEKTGQICAANGAIWQQSLDGVISVLNSADRSEEDTGIRDEFNDVFISYGRRHSLSFARKLHNHLHKKGYSVWFDMNDIPLGVDFQEQIDTGIRKAHNFIFIISPHSVKSLYCYKEIVLALKYNKRIIPVLHVEPNDCWDKMHPSINRLNWIFCRQNEDFSIPLDDWKYIDSFEDAVNGVVSLLEKHKEFVHLHTTLLDKALDWETQKYKRNMLLVGEERSEAEEWLKKYYKPEVFLNEEGNEEQPPCKPTIKHSEFICASIKNGQNLMTKVFMMYDRADLDIKEELRQALNLHAITTWSDTTDISSGAKFESAIERGMESSDNVIFLISQNSIESEYCLRELQHAFKYNKRVIPMLLEPVENIKGFQNHPELSEIQYIEFIDRRKRVDVDVKDLNDVEADVDARKESSPYKKSVDKLIHEIETEGRYYEQHKVFLVQALRWIELDRSDSLLLRGYNLENAMAWLKVGQQMSHKPTELHTEFINASHAKSGMLTSEVFISYSRKDGDFARRLNIELQNSGKTTWFDQESIASSSDFQTEIYNGIESSDNFLFVITPGSVSSVYCEDEVDYAEKQGKRFVSILLAETPLEKIPETLRKVQWIDFLNQNFTDAFSELIRALDTDREYVQNHTHWQNEALDWRKKNRPDDLLLRGSEFKRAEKWLAEADKIKKKPYPTDLQQEFIHASQASVLAAQKRAKQQRIIKRLFIAAVIMAIFLFIFGIYAYYQKGLAEEQEKLAKTEKQKAVVARDEADSLRQIADENAEDAKEQKDIAVEQKKIAVQQKNIATENEMIARRNKQIADEQRKIAEKERKIADSAKIEALKAKAETEVANEKAVFQLYEFNAFNFASTAVMSQENDKDKEILLALTAYELKRQAAKEGKKHQLNSEYDPVVIKSLQNAIKSTDNSSTIEGEIWAQQFRNGKMAVSNQKGKIFTATLENTDNKLLPKLNINEIYSDIAPNSVVLAIDFSLKGQFAAFGTSAGNVFIYNNSTETATKVYNNTRKTIVSMTFSPDESTLFYSYDNKILAVKTNENNPRVLDNSGTVISMAMRDNRYLHCVFSTGELKVLDLQYADESKKIVYSDASAYRFTKIIYLPKLNLFVGGTRSGDIVSIVSQMQTNIPRLNIQQFPARHSGSVSSIASSDDGRWIASGSFDGSLLLWELSNGIEQSIPVVFNPGNRILSLSFSSDSNYLLYADNNSLNVLPVNESLMYKMLRKEYGNKTLTKSEWNYYKRGQIEKPEIITD